MRRFFFITIKKLSVVGVKYKIDILLIFKILI